MKILDSNGLIDNIYKYVQTNIEIAKVEVQERIENTLKKIIIIAVLVMFAVLFAFFAFITIALFLNELLKSNYAGFGIVTIFLGLMMAIVFYLGKQLLNDDQIKSLHEHPQDYSRLEDEQ